MKEYLKQRGLKYELYSGFFTFATVLLVTFGSQLLLVADSSLKIDSLMALGVALVRPVLIALGTALMTLKAK